MICWTLNGCAMRKRVVLMVAVLAFAAGWAIRGQAQPGRQAGLIDPNMATEQQLAALPGLNAALIKTLIERRPFLGITDLDALLNKSLSKQQLAELYAKMFLQINLNTASEAEILLIPGIGPRMVREFKEYRPYRTIEQFRREMGKYVSEKEVARLERYVTVN